MPRCNFRRCGFLYVCTCFSKSSDCYCANRLTPKQCDKKITELKLDSIEELWNYVRSNK